jgi:hypothetical protein
MNRYIFLPVIFSCLNAFTMEANPDCAILETELAKALKEGQLGSEALYDETLQECFSPQLLITNDYEGGEGEYYQKFMDRVLDKLPESLPTIKAQVDLTLGYFRTWDDPKEIVNTISLYKFTKFDRDFHAIATGFGDDDFFAIAIFLADSSDMLLAKLE